MILGNNPKVQKAVNEIERAYLKVVNNIIEELMDNVKAGEIEDSDALQDRLHEEVDSAVLYTWDARLMLIATDNPDAYEDDFGDKPEGPEQAAYASLMSDIQDRLDVNELFEDEDEDDDE